MLASKSLKEFVLSVPTDLFFLKEMCRLLSKSSNQKIRRKTNLILATLYSIIRNHFLQSMYTYTLTYKYTHTQKDIRKNNSPQFS